jgi:ATP-binding cassette, subfamily B (MDR/TAP), member 1
MGEDHAGEEALLADSSTKQSNPKSKWRSLFNFSSRQHAPILLVALLLAAAAGITGPALAIFFRKTFNAFSAYGSGTDGHVLMHKISKNAIALCILGGTVWLLKGGHSALWMLFGELQAKTARDMLFQNLLEKDFEWYEMRASGIGALLPRLQTYVKWLRSLY